MAVDDGDIEQPELGQDEPLAQDALPDSPYRDYLERLPEEVRGDVEPIFKEWDGNVTRMRQADVEYRQQWEPLERLGIGDRDPEQIQWGMQFVDALDDPQAIQAWFNNYAQQNGLTQAEQQQLADTLDEYADPNVEQIVEQRVNQQLGPVAQQLAELAEWRSTQEQQHAEQQAMGQIEAELSDLADKHPKEFDRDMVEMFVANHMDDPEHAVQLAFADCQRIVNQIQKDTLQGKVSQPPAAESGGSANGMPEPPPKGKALEFAAEQALAQLRGSRGV